MEQVIAKTKSVVNEFIQKGLELRKKARYNAKRRALWVKHREAMIAMEAADLLEHILDHKHYGFGNHYMCIVAKHHPVKMKLHPDTRDRLVSFINWAIFPEATLFSHLGKRKELPEASYKSTPMFIENHGVPYYREMIKKIRKVHGFIDYLGPYKG
jgi:hypothetical protein